MGDEDKKVRFERIRRQIRESTRRVGQASLAAGVLVLSGPASGISPDTSPEDIEIQTYDEATPDQRVSQPTALATGPLASDQIVREDFDQAFSKEFSDTTPA